ncbi:hypothetical protein P3T76_011563 [Phytophthora citrophthora]|uniref:Cns1/TTC4 wheel domain-containing protein n=1 Tax=Phytophthora citrophthora TaxID=4793 RepID=A0AAD9LEP4_9STRA|nr:hypothetical protein P3T76_011563 [Phytophthora citrophthora]
MEFFFPCDPASVAAFLSGMTRNEYGGGFESDSGDADRFEELGEPLSAQEEVIERFKTMRAKFVRPGGIFAEQTFTRPMVAHVMTMDDTRPQSEVRSLRDLKPMIGKELKLGVTHKGRYLCGWVAVDDAFFGIASTSLLLEDVTGYMVEIAAYGLVDTELPPHERQRILSRKFPKGRAIVVLEPYYKVRMDGSVGVRVDNANEILPWQDEPTDLTTWKNLGNEFFSRLNSDNEGHGALACYQRALQAVESEVHSLVLLLNNIATCRCKMKDYASSIQFSGAAVHLDPTYFKGWYRLASALTEIAADPQKGGSGDGDSVVARVIAQARIELPSMSSGEERLLECVVKKATSARSRNHSSLESYAQWTVNLSFSRLIVVPGDSSELKAADVWRLEGSEYFKKGNYQEAGDCYRKGLAALTSCCQNVSIVLNNIAAVHLVRSQKMGTDCKLGKMPSIEACLLNCSVAGVIDPLNHKAWLRRDRCLQALGFTNGKCVQDLDEVQASVMTIESEQQNDRLTELKRCLDAAIQQHLQKHSASKSSQEAPAREESTFGVPFVEDTESIDEYIAQMEGFVSRTRFAFALTGSNSRIYQLPPELKMFLTNPPPEIHIDFPKLRAWPDGVTSDFALKVLHRAYLEACVRPWIDAHRMRDGSFFQGITAADMMKRWHGTGALEIMRARGGVRLGDIVDGREARGDYQPRYEAHTRASFANNPSRPEVYYFGSTHVAIGFCDFSSLLAATLCEKPSTNGPLRYVGFDMSEFAVAKGKVVAKMLKSPTISVSSVMEVWLSTTWSDTTLKDFRECVDAVLESMNEQHENSTVLAYVRHWVTAEPVSAAEAHCAFWGDLVKHNKAALGSLCSFHRQIDRLDLTEYMLSGEIRASVDVLKLVEKERPGAVDVRTKSKKKRDRKKKKKTTTKSEPATPTSLVGNLTMFNVPAGSPPLNDDIAFNTVDFCILLEDFIQREKKDKRSTSGLSVVDLFLIHILKNLNRLRGLMQRNQLRIEVHYGVLKAVRGEAVNDHVNQQLLTRIARMRPDSISWSNIVDYFLPDDFHDLARRCSMFGNCMHYGYSMNWPTQVCGLSVIDLGKEEFQGLLNYVIDSALGFISDLPPAPIPMIDMVDMLKVLGLDNLLVLPFREHPLNNTAYVLAQLFNDEWTDHFMKKGVLTAEAKRRLGAMTTLSNSGLQMGAMEIPLPCPLNRSSLTLQMSWCYDPRVHLVPNNQSEATPEDMAMLARLMEHFSP